jgi:SAM-dependent methyltransferase
VDVFRIGAVFVQGEHRRDERFRAATRALATDPDRALQWRMGRQAGRPHDDAGMAVTVAVTPPPRGPVRGFARWVAESTEPGAAVLNVGGGCNASGRFPCIRRRAAHLVVVDPSARVFANSDADQRHQQTLEEFSRDHAEEFDVAFAVFVLEHVADPVAFTEAAARVLKPGGVFLALTLNQWHFFGLMTWAASRLGLEEWLLRQVRDPDCVDRYHVHTEYHLNTIRSARRHLERAGFSQVEFRMWDLPRMYEPYLPARLRGVARRWDVAAYRLARPNLMGHLTFKAVR